MGKAVDAPGTRSLLSCRLRSSSAAASAANPAEMPRLPSSENPSRWSLALRRLKTSMAKAAPMPELPAWRASMSLSLAVSCRKASLPVRAASGSVASTSTRNSSPSAMSR